MRTERDCVLLSASVTELNCSQQALLLGLLLGEYTKHPESKFWDVFKKFQRVAAESRWQAAQLVKEGD